MKAGENLNEIDNKVETISGTSQLQSYILPKVCAL